MTKGLMSGRTMCTNICQELAPSMSAASKGSIGSDRRPARMMSAMKGVHCHTSTAITAHRATLALPSQLTMPCPA
jgi:hypothetical protein